MYVYLTQEDMFVLNAPLSLDKNRKEQKIKKKLEQRIHF
jgi:hypothetical protein